MSLSPLSIINAKLLQVDKQLQQTDLSNDQKQKLLEQKSLLENQQSVFSGDMKTEQKFASANTETSKSIFDQ